MTYTAYTDGACRGGNPGLCCAGFAVFLGEGLHCIHARVLDGINTNNVSEFTALLDLLEWAKKYDVQNLTIYSDSMLVVMTSTAQWGIKPHLEKYAARAFTMLTEGNHTLLHVKGHAGNMGNECIDVYLNDVLDRHQGITKKRRKSDVWKDQIEKLDSLPSL